MEIGNLLNLPNRYGDKNTLEVIQVISEKDIVCKLNFEDKEAFYRYGYTHKGVYDFVDPSGGPYLSLGSFIPGTKFKIKKIDLDRTEGCFKFYCHDLSRNKRKKTV